MNGDTPSVLFFGTYDERTHPRVRVLREGLEAHGASVAVCNAPLELATAARVEMARKPWKAIRLAMRLLRCWARLIVRSRGQRPDVVVVGYLGQLDVHLARLRFRRATVVLDLMVTMGDTVRDRGLQRAGLARFLTTIDRAAIRSADVVVVDTEEHRSLVPSAARDKTVVVPVGAPSEWFRARHEPGSERPLRVAFFGLFTPLQGATTIGEAIRAVDPHLVSWTLIGTGQDLTATRAAAGDRSNVTWIDWLDEDALAKVVADHHVCLGIFGTSEKAQRVVPNKVFQGAAAGCAIVTSDTPPQRRALGAAAVFVPPGDPQALAAAITELAHDPDALRSLRQSSAATADASFSPTAIVTPLLEDVEARP